MQRKTGGYNTELWAFIKKELQPTLSQLGILTPEEMGYDKPELALQDVYDMWDATATRVFSWSLASRISSNCLDLCSPAHSFADSSLVESCILSILLLYFPNINLFSMYNVCL